MEAQFDAWVKDNSSVHKSWDAFFKNLHLPPGKAVTLPRELVGGINERYDGAPLVLSSEAETAQAEDYMKRFFSLFSCYFF